jgi:hypothetical protein
MNRSWQTKRCFKRHAKSSLFGVAFDQLGSSGKAFLGFITSNLPPSKEGRQGDCAHTNKLDVHKEKAVSFRRQHFIQPSLALARPASGSCMISA